jgi:myosin heavy subunit
VKRPSCKKASYTTFHLTPPPPPYLSSRFGKYIRLKYDDSDRIIGAKTEHFLLEKSRLIHVEEGERNYHSFYQLCAGLDEKTRGELGLRTAKDYVLLNQGNTLVASADVDDVKEFEETVNALATLKISADEQGDVFKLLAGLLHLGNCKAAYPGGNEEENVELSNHDEAIDIAKIAEIFGVDAILLKNTVCVRMQTSGRGR